MFAFVLLLSLVCLFCCFCCCSYCPLSSPLFSASHLFATLFSSLLFSSLLFSSLLFSSLLVSSLPFPSFLSTSSLSSFTYFFLLPSSFLCFVTTVHNTALTELEFVKFSSEFFPADNKAECKPLYRSCLKGSMYILLSSDCYILGPSVQPVIDRSCCKRSIRSAFPGFQTSNYSD